MDGSASLTRQEMLDQLANRLIALQIQHPVRVAVDGIDAAGKTTLADELALLLTSRGRIVIRASMNHVLVTPALSGTQSSRHHRGRPDAMRKGKLYTRR
jgi:hypothetical protein